MPSVEVSIVVDAPARDVYELAKDQERFPDFMPDVESVNIVERAGDRIVSRWKTLSKKRRSSGPRKTFSTTTASRSTTSCSKAISTRSREPGVRDGDGRTTVTLVVDYDFGVPTLAELIGPTLHKKVKENAEMMLAGLKKEAESKI